ncbi:MAG: mercuric transport protein MerT [Gammaproteobacteria bacterium]|nr:MAG: mercuric transport protein MerT [Gammaproteobacteria bacterium]
MADSSATDNHTTITSVIGASLGAIGASLCCIGPLVLLSLGIGGAWVSTLTALTPYRWIFITITLGFLGWSFYKLYIAPRQCAPDDVCAIPATLRNQRIIFWVVSVLLAALIAFPWYGTIFFE